MPTYRVWYKDNETPLEFVTAARLDDIGILEHVFEAEQIDQSEVRSAKEMIAKHALGRVRYTEDESEMNTIG